LLPRHAGGGNLPSPVAVRGDVRLAGTHRGRPRTTRPRGQEGPGGFVDDADQSLRQSRVVHGPRHQLLGNDRRRSCRRVDDRPVARLRALGTAHLHRAGIGRGLRLARPGPQAARAEWSRARALAGCRYVTGRWSLSRRAARARRVAPAWAASSSAAAPSGLPSSSTPPGSVPCWGGSARALLLRFCLLNFWPSWGLAGWPSPRVESTVRTRSVSQSASPASPW